MAPTHLLLAAALAAAADPAPEADAAFLRRYAETRGFMLGRPTGPQFTPDGKHVLFLRAAGPATPRQGLFEFDVAAGTARELLTPEGLLRGAEETLSADERARRERQRVAVGGFAGFHLDGSGSRVLVVLSGKPYVFDRTTGKVRELRPGPGPLVDPKWSPDGKFVSYVRNFDVYAYDLAADQEIAVTTGGTRDKTHGLAEFVAQEEMDRHTGYWWSPDAAKIAYTEADHSGVEAWHIADPLRPDAEPQPQFYPRPGKKNVAVRLGVKAVRGGDTTWVEWDGNRFEYLARVAWGRPGLLVAAQSRDHRQIAHRLVDPTNGRMTFEMGYTAGSSEWLDLPPDPISLADDNTFFAVAPLVLPTGGGPECRRFEGNFLSFPAGGGVFTRRSAAFDEVLRIAEVDGRRRLVFAAGGDDPTLRHIYRATPAGPGRPADEEPLTTAPGVHTAVVSKDAATTVVTTTTLDRMPTSTVRRVQPGGEPLGTLPSVAEEPPFAPNVSIQKVGDGDGYWTAVVRPRRFDPAKKYPVIADVYGGPQHIHVTRAMRRWLLPQWLADHGFVVVSVDNRGTPGRGRDWEQAVYQKFGTVPLEDQVKGLHALCDRFPELDRDRVGVVGWSFGGYMAANAVLRRPDVYKAAVAGAPVTDWEDYDTHYTERYLGLLPESRKAYDEASLIPLAKDLARPLLLVHGTADDNVYFRHTLKLTDALFRAGRAFDVLPLPGVTHMSSADPVVLEQLWTRTAAYFHRHLGGPE